MTFLVFAILAAALGHRAASSSSDRISIDGTSVDVIEQSQRASSAYVAAVRTLLSQYTLTGIVQSSVFDQVYQISILSAQMTEEDLE